MSWNIYFKNWKKKRENKTIVQIKKNQPTDTVLVDHMKKAFTVAMQVFVFDRLQCEAVWKAGWAVGLQTEDTQTGGLKKKKKLA